jgi:hypothetical protein
MGARSQASKTYLEKNVGKLEGLSLDEVCVEVSVHKSEENKANVFVCFFTVGDSCFTRVEGGLGGPHFREDVQRSGCRKGHALSAFAGGRFVVAPRGLVRNGLTPSLSATRRVARFFATLLGCHAKARDASGVKVGLRYIKHKFCYKDDHALFRARVNIKS